MDLLQDDNFPPSSQTIYTHIHTMKMKNARSQSIVKKGREGSKKKIQPMSVPPPPRNSASHFPSFLFRRLFCVRPSDFFPRGIFATA